MNIIYSVCKRTIERGDYSQDLITRIDAFYKANLFSKKEYEELKKLLNK